MQLELLLAKLICTQLQNKNVTEESRFYALHFNNVKLKV